jgi:hypothetical protein
MADHVLALRLKKLLLFLKVLEVGKVLRHKALGRAYLGKSDSLLMLKTVCLKLEYALFTYKNAFDIARHFVKNVFGTTARGLLVRDNVF